MRIYGLSGFKNIVKSVLAKIGRQLNRDAQQELLLSRQDIAQATHDVKSEFKTVRELIRQNIARLEEIEKNAHATRIDHETHFAHLKQSHKNALHERRLAKQEILQAAHNVSVQLKIDRELVRQDFTRIDQVNERLDQFNRELLRISKIVSKATAPIKKLSAPACTDAGELFLLFAELSRKAELWNQCELLISCPATHSGAASLFPGKNITLVDQPRDLYQAIAGRKFNTFGILSPWLIRPLESHQEIFFYLIQACRDRLLIVDGRNTGKDNAQLRKILHRSGFYEIAVPTSPEVFDFSTVNCAPDGRFDYNGSEPGLPSNLDEWTTLAALRLPLSHVKRMPWKSVTFSPIASTGMSFGAEPGGFALAVARPDDDCPAITKIDISGTVHWTDASLGHASLVSCYAGPDDTHMYASVLETVEDIGTFISIWLNNGQWTRLAHIQVPGQLITVEPTRFSLPLWLRVDTETVSTGSRETCLLKESNRELARIPCAGIRIAEGCISISEISYAFC